MNSVVMVYPDKRYVERDPEGGGHPGGLDSWENYWTKAGLGVSKEEFRRRASLINFLLDTYRKKDHRVYWTVFSLDEDSTQPDVDNIHPMYHVKAEDLIVPVGVSYRQLKHSWTYPDARGIIQQLPLGKKAIFGGFHQGDCVDKFANAAHSLGIIAEIDELLTQRWLSVVNESFNCDLDALLITKGMMISDDDNPEEQKYWLFHERIPKEELRIRYRLLNS